MPGYPDHDGRVRSSRGLFGFFCSRRGAGVARAMIAAWCVAGTFLGAPLLWVGGELYHEFKATRESVNRIEQYIAGAVVRGQGWERRIGVLESDVKVNDNRLDDHEKRIFRMEPRR